MAPLPVAFPAAGVAPSASGRFISTRAAATRVLPRIHGTNDLESVGNSGSAGCIRLFNHDIIFLFDMVPIGTPVHVRSEAESLRVDQFGRGIELPARSVDPSLIYSEEAIANDPPPVFDDPRDGMPADSGDVPI